MSYLVSGAHRARVALAVIMACSLFPTGARQAIPAMTFGTIQIEYEGFFGVRTNGNDSTYGQGLTHRYVDGELRFLTLTLGGRLHEFRVSGMASSATVTETTGVWDIGDAGALNSFNGVWFEQAKNRLWVASSEDYTNQNHPAKITTLTLGTNGQVENVHTVYLDVPAKRVYGGCNAVPPSLVALLGGPYVCGWGGYTSLVAQGGGASVGPTMFAIADPASVGAGERLRTRTVLDAAGNSRGVRKSIPINYFDGGDRRQNPPTRPTTPPDRSAAWLSPNREGLGWMVWGDSYYNTGFWIGTTYGAVASLCKGACWYQTSTLAFDGRQFELHLWDGSALGRNRLARPSAMFDLDLPRDNDRVWGGNSPTGNVAGATYDPTSGRLYMIGFPFGADYHTGRLYAFRVTGG